MSTTATADSRVGVAPLERAEIARRLGKIVDAEHGQKVLASFEETVGQIGQAPVKVPAKVVAIETATR